MRKCPKCGRSFSREGQGQYCGKVETIDQYISEQDETVKPYLNEVRQILRAALPEAQEKISWSISNGISHFTLDDFYSSTRTIDWEKQDDARAKMRMMIKGLLNKYHYPPEGMEDALKTVMEQCELWTDNELYDVAEYPAQMKEPELKAAEPERL